jgi:hypothetical protein
MLVLGDSESLAIDSLIQWFTVVIDSKEIWFIPLMALIPP